MADEDIERDAVTVLEWVNDPDDVFESVTDLVSSFDRDLDPDFVATESVRSAVGVLLALSDIMRVDVIDDDLEPVSDADLESVNDVVGVSTSLVGVWVAVCS